MSGALLNEPVGDRTRQAVLDYVLALHPQQHLTIPALVNEMQAGVSDYGGGTELECAIRDHVSAGILWLRAGEVWPTQLALETQWQAI